MTGIMVCSRDGDMEALRLLKEARNFCMIAIFDVEMTEIDCSRWSDSDASYRRALEAMLESPLP